MRILFTFMCVLALGAMGCGETTGTGGNGGTAGMGGNGGTAGMGGNGGGVAADCTGAEDNTRCLLRGNDPETTGRCVSEVCFVDTCAVVNNGTNCLACGDPCDVEYLGLCVDKTCRAPMDDCTDYEREDVEPCWLNEERSEMGVCVDDVCVDGAAPEIGFISWGWLDPCDANASGQGLIVTVAAIDRDTPMEQLTWSGQVQDCTPDLNAVETILTCEVYLGARQSEAIVTDPQGHQDTMPFAPDPCTGGCVGGCP